MEEKFPLVGYGLEVSEFNFVRLDSEPAGEDWDSFLERELETHSYLEWVLGSNAEIIIGLLESLPWGMSEEVKKLTPEIVKEEIYKIISPRLSPDVKKEDVLNGVGYFKTEV